MTSVVEQLAVMPNLGEVPREELEWLVRHGQVEVHETGVIMAPGQELDHLWIILSGRVVVRVDRGVGPRRAIEWPTGHITGMLPYSRVGKVRNDVLAEVRTELLSIHQKHFPEMVHRCPSFTAITVHSMLDRARRFNTNDLQDEKMISLGKLAAGLAHELNNPASATKRGAKLLRAGLSDAERASRELSRVGLSENLIETIEQMCSDWLKQADPTSSLDRERSLESWLASHQLDEAQAGPLAEAFVTVNGLDELARLVSEETLDAALRWIVAGSTTRLVAKDIEEAATRIYELVEAVKRFTYMDKVSGTEAVDVEAGLRDTIQVIASRAKEKEATVSLRAEPNLPSVQAVGSDLNQVWMNLIENALDVVSLGGHVEVTARRELDRVVIRVIDDGPGIEPELISRIFDPFFTTKEPGRGMGLGLEITRQLVRRHQGEISVESKAGRTEFRVSLLEAPTSAGRGDPPNEVPVTLRRLVPKSDLPGREPTREGSEWEGRS